MHDVEACYQKAEVNSMTKWLGVQQMIFEPSFEGKSEGFLNFMAAVTEKPTLVKECYTSVINGKDMDKIYEFGAKLMNYSDLIWGHR